MTSPALTPVECDCVQSIKESIRPAYLMRANSRRIMQRKTMAEKRAMTMLGGVNDDAGAEEEEEDVDEGEEEQVRAACVC